MTSVSVPVFDKQNHTVRDKTEKNGIFIVNLKTHFRIQRLLVLKIALVESLISERFRLGVAIQI